jgi:hypothetical protein
MTTTTTEVMTVAIEPTAHKQSDATTIEIIAGLIDMTSTGATPAKPADGKKMDTDLRPQETIHWEALSSTNTLSCDGVRGVI